MNGARLEFEEEVRQCDDEYDELDLSVSASLESTVQTQLQQCLIDGEGARDAWSTGLRQPSGGAGGAPEAGLDSRGVAWVLGGGGGGRADAAAEEEEGEERRGGAAGADEAGDAGGDLPWGAGAGRRAGPFTAARGAPLQQERALTPPPLSY